MPKIVKPTIAASLGTRLALPGSLHAGLRVALQSIEDQRREGLTDAHEALKATFDTVENQRRAG